MASTVIPHFTGGVTEISFTNGEAWSNFYTRMTADKYDFYMVITRARRSSYEYYMSGVIMPKAILDYLNNTSPTASTNVTNFGVTVRDAYYGSFTKDANGKLETTNLYKIYGVKLG